MARDTRTSLAQTGQVGSGWRIDAAVLVAVTADATPPSAATNMLSASPTKPPLGVVMGLRFEPCG